MQKRKGWLTELFLVASKKKKRGKGDYGDYLPYQIEEHKSLVKLETKRKEKEKENQLLTYSCYWTSEKQLTTNLLFFSSFLSVQFVKQNQPHY